MRRRTVWLLLFANVLLADVGRDVYRGYWASPDPPIRLGMTWAEVDDMMKAAGYSPGCGPHDAYNRDTGWFGDYRTVYVRFDHDGRLCMYEAPPPYTGTGRHWLNRAAKLLDW